MRLHPELSEPRFRRRLPRRTIRVRLAVLFFAVYLASGAALLAVTVAVWQSRTGGVTVAAVPVPTGGLRHPATGITQHSSDRHQLLIASGIGLAIMAGASLAVGWLVAGRFLRPLRTITATTRKISATNLHERLHLTGPDDELKELADTFDELLERLERSFAFERQFVSNASHELRTPLAGMRTSLDVAMAKPGPVPPHVVTLADRLRRELDQIDRLLESFLTLAHSQQGPLADESTVSLAELARVAIERRADAISAMGLEVEQQQGSDVWVAGSTTLLARMVENVIDNAVGHNQPGGWVRVTTPVEGEHAASRRRERRPGSRSRSGRTTHPAVPPRGRRANRLGQRRRTRARDRLLDRRGSRRRARPRRPPRRRAAGHDHLPLAVRAAAGASA